MALLALLIGAVAAAEPPPLRNALAGHPSPYLAMHGDDPVHWQEWGPEVLERARREGKPVFVSIGYFSCHWCHVMQRESYRDRDIAALLNRHFVPVKVDRELNPALDARLIEFVERTRGYAGWPLNVFLTPEGYPLVGLVYLPPDEFRVLLERLQARWLREPAELRRIAREAGRALGGGARAAGPELPAGAAGRLQEALAAAAMLLADPLEGGFGGPNKFPQVPQLEALLDVLAQRPDGELADFLRITLDHMADGGLRDHLRGGFFRYVVDPGWTVPHFEKMLYDNALLAALYLRAARDLNQPRYREVAFDTLDFLLAEMRHPAGGFVASLSAVDARGVEGGFYLWADWDLRQLLSEEQRAVAERVWGLTGPPELPDGHHLTRAMTVAQAAAELGIPDRQAARRLAEARRALLQAQGARTLPRDTKVLAAWNGLALRALSLGAAADPAYRPAARALRDLLAEVLWDGERLLRAQAGGKALGEGSLEDYAYAAAGLWAWSRLPGNEGDVALVHRLLEEAWSRFHDPLGWRLSQDSPLPFVARDAVLADGPMPAPAAVVIETSLAVAEARGDPALRRRALTALNVAHDRLREDPFAYASQIRVLARATERAGAALRSGP